MPIEIVTHQNDQGNWEAAFTVQLKGEQGETRVIRAVGDRGTTEEDIIKIAKRQMQLAKHAVADQWNKMFTQGKARVFLGKWGRRKRDVLMWRDPAKSSEFVPYVLGPVDARGHLGVAASTITECTRPYFGLKVKEEKIRRNVADQDYQNIQQRMQQNHYLQVEIVPQVDEINEEEVKVEEETN